MSKGTASEVGSPYATFITGTIHECASFGGFPFIPTLETAV